MSSVSWNIACVLTNTSVPAIAVACFTGFPSIMSLTFSCLSGVTSPDALTNLIDSLPTYKSLKKFALEPKLHLLFPSGIMEPVITKATKAEPSLPADCMWVPEPEYIEPLMYVVPPKVVFPLDVIFLISKSPLELIFPEAVMFFISKSPLAVMFWLTFNIPNELVPLAFIPAEAVILPDVFILILLFPDPVTIKLLKEPVCELNKKEPDCEFNVKELVCEANINEPVAEFTTNELDMPAAIWVELLIAPTNVPIKEFAVILPLELMLPDDVRFPVKFNSSVKLIPPTSPPADWKLFA